MQQHWTIDRVVICDDPLVCVYRKEKGGPFFAAYAVRVGKQGTMVEFSTNCMEKCDAIAFVCKEGLVDIAKGKRKVRTLASGRPRGDNADVVHVNFIFDRWMDYRVSLGLAPGTITGAASIVRKWIDDTNVKTNLDLQAVRYEEFGKLLNGDKKLALGRRASKLAAFRSFFNFARDEGYITKNPCRLVRLTLENVPEEKRESKHYKTWTEQNYADFLVFINKLVDEYSSYVGKPAHEFARYSRECNHGLPYVKAAACEVADESMPPIAADVSSALNVAIQILREVRFAAIVCHDTGMRIGDAQTIRWTHFTSKPGHVVFWPDKTNRRLECPISQTLSDALAEQGVYDMTYILPLLKADKDKVVTGSRLIYEALYAIRKVRPEFKELSYHGLRRAFVTRIVDQAKKTWHPKHVGSRTLTEEEAMDVARALVGHASSKQTEVYYEHKKA